MLAWGFELQSPVMAVLWVLFNALAVLPLAVVGWAALVDHGEVSATTPTARAPVPFGVSGAANAAGACR